MRIETLRSLIACCLLIFLAACGSAPPTSTPEPFAQPTRRAEFSEQGHEVTLFALGLIDTGYRFGGKNPEAGLDCSGMVNHVFASALGRRLGASAADIARGGSVVEGRAARPGDLVFFDTRGGRYTHVGIYLGEARFIHAPSSKGKVRIDRLDQGWFAPRLSEVRRYIE